MGVILGRREAEEAEGENGRRGEGGLRVEMRWGRSEGRGGGRGRGGVGGYAARRRRRMMMRKGVGVREMGVGGGRAKGVIGELGQLNI